MLALSFEEDIGEGDLTTLAIVEPGLLARARVVAGSEGVVAGMALLEPMLAAMRRRERSEEEAGTLTVTDSRQDGEPIGKGEQLCGLDGSPRALLALERTALNYLSRLCGIATLTAAFVERVAATGSDARVLDTRKTLPGHRVLDKYAVRCGGGHNHRGGLFDAILIKDNHIAAAGDIGAAVAVARMRTRDQPIQCECEDLDELRDALDAGADSILFDNFTPELVRKAVKLVAGRCRVEVSGGVDLDNVADFARAGAADISAGMLTHSAPAFDLSMTIERVK